MLIAAGVIVGLIVVLGVIGAVAGKGERKRAPQKLAEAKALWAGKQRKQTLEALREAFFDAGGEYSPDELKLTLEATDLVDAVLKEQSINPAPLTQEARASLAQGKAPSHKALERIQKLLKRAADKPEKLWSEVLSLDTPVFSADLEDAGTPSSGAMLDPEVEIINQVGKSLVFGGTAKALGIINTYLATATGAFKAALLSQRGGCHSMDDKHAEAAADYAACIELEPEQIVHRTNLAEALLAQGQVQQAREQVSAAAQHTRTKKQRETVDNMLRWF